MVANLDPSKRSQWSGGEGMTEKVVVGKKLGSVDEGWRFWGCLVGVRRR